MQLKLYIPKNIVLPTIKCHVKCNFAIYVLMHSIVFQKCRFGAYGVPLNFAQCSKIARQMRSLILSSSFSLDFLSNVKLLYFLNL